MSTLTLTASYVYQDEDGYPRYVVSAKCNERPDLDTRYSMSCGPNKRLAERLVAAVNAGKAWTDVRVEKDNHDVEYVCFDGSKVMGRYLNADLKRLGF